MKLYHVFFRTYTREGYQMDDKFVVVKKKGSLEWKKPVEKDPRGGFRGVLATENDIKNLWEFGNGIDRLEFLGELDDSLFNPVLSESDFVADQIRSKKNNECIGYQG